MTKLFVIAAMVALTGCAGTKTRADIETLKYMQLDCSRKQEQIAFLESQRYTKDEKMLLVLTTPMWYEVANGVAGNKTEFRRVKSNEYDFVIEMRLRELRACPR